MDGREIAGGQFLVRAWTGNLTRGPATAQVESDVEQRKNRRFLEIPHGESPEFLLRFQFFLSYSGHLPIIIPLLSLSHYPLSSHLYII